MLDNEYPNSWRWVKRDTPMHGPKMDLRVLAGDRIFSIGDEQGASSMWYICPT
jgi:hypothetical protein